MNKVILSLLVITVAFSGNVLFGQGGQTGQQGQRGQRAAVPARPTPRLANGRVNLGPPEGEKGIWAPAGIVQLYIFPNSVNRASAASALPNAIKLEDVPFQPWAKALHEAREANFESDEPHTRCKASPGPREFITPYGVEFVDAPELQRMYIFDIGGPHTYRTIFMDGRPHPKDLKPTYYGHSTGKWEGDTLVVEVIANDDRTWFDRAGNYHSNQMKVTERYTPLDANRMQYEATIEDPETFSKPWTISMHLYRNTEPNAELLEFKCVEFSENLLYNEFLKEPLP